MCGVLALPQRGQRLRAGTFSFHALARRLRVFDFEVFFFGTAIVGPFVAVIVDAELGDAAMLVWLNGSQTLSGNPLS